MPSMPQRTRNFLADFEVQEVAQELLAQQGAPATSENLSRAMNAVIADPNIARATHSGSQLYAERVEQILAPSVDRYSTGPIPGAAAGLDLTGGSDAGSVQQVGDSSVRTDNSNNPAQSVPQQGSAANRGNDGRGQAGIPSSGNVGGNTGSISGTPPAIPNGTPTIPGTSIADTHIDNASDGFSLLELLLGGAGAGAAAAGFNAFTEPRAANAGGPVNIPAQDVAIDNARTGEFIPAAARGTPQLGTPQGPGATFVNPVNQLDNLTGEVNAPTSGQSGPIAATGSSGPDVNPNSGGNAATPARAFAINEAPQAERLITDTILGGPTYPVVMVDPQGNANPIRNSGDVGELEDYGRGIGTAAELAREEGIPNAPQARGADVGPDVPTPPEMDLAGAATKPNADKLAHVKDIKKYEAALMERIAAGEGNQVENQKELRQVRAFLKRMSSTLR